MARTSKKEKTAKALTPEEKLAAALVPVEEQPYPVPGNWCWTRLDNLLLPSKDKTENFSDLSVRYVGLENIESNAGISSFGTVEGIKSLKNIFTAGQILYGKLRPYLNKHDIASFDGVCSTDILVFSNKSTTLSKYVDYFFNTQSFIEYVVSNSKGINLPRVSESVVLDAICPLAPLAEQQRIVDRIESLFAKLDEAKEKAQAVVDSFEDRKAAILHKAFTGDLTTVWRQKNSIPLTSWKRTVLQDVCDKIVCGKTPKEYITAHGDIPYLKVYNIVDDTVDFTKAPQFIPASIHKGKLASSTLRPNDVIMNIVGPPLRKIAIVPNTYNEWNMNQAIVRFRPKSELFYRYLYYALLYPPTLEEVISATRGVVGQANISVSQSRSLIISLPTYAEQKEVVRLLDNTLAKERQAKEAAEQALVQIDTMKKAILARAFRGELGTNDPTDESAAEMLKRII